MSHTPTTDLPVLLDSRTLRDHYGLSDAEIAKAWRHLDTYRIADGRRIKVRRDDLEAWLETFRQPAHSPMHAA